ncbi:MAG: T9SS type A sorting domain-containing protein, partial [Candidatus Cloacimonetes bacterium]|nr:T9SS type A sorting domain-containing protein [Candidatus Cloacimonadota bacterium]
MQKKLIIVALFTLLTSAVFATPMNVVAEVFTASWCGNCPDARKGINELADNYDNLIPLIWQSASGYVGDIPSPNYGGRGSLYGVQGIPHAQFGGIHKLVGVPPIYADLYAAYLQRYDAVNNISSPLALDIELNASGNNLIITANVEVTAEVTTTNNKIVYILTNEIDSDYSCAVVKYADSPFSLTEIGETGSFTNEFSLDENWDLTKIKAVALVQTFSGDRMILQAATSGFTGLMPFISSNVSSGPASLYVEFSDNSLPKDGVVSWEWDLDGDGVFDSIEENPSFLYENPGTYNITLKIFDGNEYAERTFEDYITVQEAGVPFSGKLSGNWLAANNPYVIDGDVTIEEGSELIIAAGTEIKISNTTFLVSGRITADASGSIPISFTSNTNWGGISLIGKDQESVFNNCLFSNATNSAITIENGPIVEITNSVFSNNHSSSKAAGIEITNSDSVSIIKTTFIKNSSENNSGAIACNGSSPIIKNNLIINNEAAYGAFSFKSDSTPTLINNTIANNKSEKAAIMLFNSNAIIMNSILRDETKIILNIASTPEISYCNIQGGFDGTGNIDADPMFENIDICNFMLATGSPCINAGNPDTKYNDLDDSINDMGAWGGPQALVGLPVATDDNYINSVNPIKLSVYPNPFNPTTTICFNSSSDLGEDATIEIYNVKGQKIRSFNIVNTKANKSVIWNGKDSQGKSSSSGVYLIKFQSGN